MSDQRLARADRRAPTAEPVVLEHSRAPEKMAADKVRCEACPVLCQISPGKLGACDRYGNVDGRLTRLDTLHLVARPGVDLVAWQAAQRRRLGRLRCSAQRPTRRCSSRASARARPIPTTSRRPSSSRSQHDGVDLVTVVTEGIFSYCSFKVKIDTDRYLGPEQATVRHRRRGGRPRQHDRVRLAVPGPRRRPPPDRRLEEGRRASPAS